MIVSDVVRNLEEAQRDDHDTRETSRECGTFCDKKDGQWEQRIWDKFKGRPRYTFDKVNHIIDLICSSIETKSYNIRVTCDDADATPELAELRNGILRNIEKVSKAQSIYNRAMRKVIKTGFDAWRIKTRWKKGEFVQEPYIEYIPNSVDRVWFDPDSVEPDGSDAKYCWVMSQMSKEKFKETWPDAAISPIGSDRQFSEYWYKPDLITVGEYLWCEEKSSKLCLLNNGMIVTEKNPNYEKLKEFYGVNRERDDTEYVWYSRPFSATDWLEDKKRLIFDSCPVVPVYGNFDYSDGKRIYRGVVERLMDPQRVLNYAKSRAIEEGALQPRRKWWMTREMAGDQRNQQKLSKMNTSADPVEFFELDSKNPSLVPFQGGNNEINPHLTQLSGEMANDIEAVAGKYGVSLGKNDHLQSGVALELQEMQASLGDIKWEMILATAVNRTAELLLEVLPKVMDTSQRVTTLSEDGKTTSIEQVNTYEKGAFVNNMNQGRYSCTIDITEGYNSRQKETVKGMLEVAAVKPEILDVGADIFMSNINAPGMGDLADRYRQMLLQSGQIPLDQMTDEEKEQAMVQMQNQQPNPQDMVLQAEAQARIMEGQAAIQNEVNDANKIAVDQFKAETDRMDTEIKAAEANVKIADTQVSTQGKMIDNSLKLRGVGAGFNKAI